MLGVHSVLCCASKFHHWLLQVVTDHGTLLSLGINADDDKERKLRESLAIRNIRAQKEQVILKNIRHVGNEVAGISSQVRRCAPACESLQLSVFLKSNNVPRLCSLRSV